MNLHTDLPATDTRPEWEVVAIENRKEHTQTQQIGTIFK
jgi:hypothetical protein